MLLISLGLLVAGSAVAALGDTLGPMVVGRLLQGPAGGVIPLGISIMRDILPSERLGVATATMGSSLGVGGALVCLLLAISEGGDWGWISGLTLGCSPPRPRTSLCGPGGNCGPASRCWTCAPPCGARFYSPT